MIFLFKNKQIFHNRSNFYMMYLLNSSEEIVWINRKINTNRFLMLVISTNICISKRWRKWL